MSEALLYLCRGTYGSRKTGTGKTDCSNDGVVSTIVI